MKIHFLSAKVPLTKSFNRGPSGVIEKSAYPLVKHFTSHDREINTPAEFCEALTQHAANGHCLLKGKLARPLSNESRAGTTSPLDPTQWSCFDLDNVKGVDTVEQFVEKILPPEFRDADYILQFSASSGVTDDTGLRAHLFFLHDKPFTPEVAKIFLTELNLDNSILSDQVTLAASGTALRFPLDRTVCQNDKLIYIAPPALGDGLTDRLGDGARICLIEKGRRYVNFDWGTRGSPATVEAGIAAHVEKLRKVGGLKPKQAKTRTLTSGELLLTNPDHANVTGEKEARGYVYLNINNGDSWGYYYIPEKPRFLYNFKGEPIVVLADFLPSYWAQIQDRLQKERKGDRPFAFRHRETDSIWNGVYDSVNNRIKGLARTTRQNLPDFFEQYHMDTPQPLEDWTFEFNPADKRLLDFEGKYCNRFEPTEYMRNPGTAHTVPPTIKRILMSVLGDDEVCYEHFLNWLATIFQTRQKLGTAWMLHGVQGTGKGVLYHYVLVPLIGRKYCASKTIGELDDQFNGFLEQCLILNLDEANIGESRFPKSVNTKLKHLISEPTLSIRRMHVDSAQTPNYTNVIFASNNYDAIEIDFSDRRVNVAPRQETPITVTEVDIHAIADEVTQFAGFLASYQINEQKARTVINNEAKRAMREASQDAMQQLCQALKDGNLEYFMQYADNTTVNADNMVAWAHFRTTIRGWLGNVGRPSVVRNTEIADAYAYLMAPRNPPGPVKFGRMLGHKNLHATAHRPPGAKKTVWGHKVVWMGSPEQVEEWRAMLTTQSEQSICGDNRVIPFTGSRTASA